MSPLRRLTLHVTCFALGAAMMLSNAWGQTADTTESPAEFKHAYETAMADAKGRDTLDPAYELLGVAGSAHERGLNDLAANAAGAFADLVQRATATATRKGGSTAQDTLDELVDLRFFAETTHLDKATGALDTAMRMLFPVAAKTSAHRAESSAAWDEKLSALRELAGLQASATQVMLADAAKNIAENFTAQVAVLSGQAAAETDEVERGRKLADVEELKRSHDEQISDATNNNVTTIAQQILSSGRSSQMLHSEADADLPQDLAEGDGSCIETGYRVDHSATAVPDAELHRRHDRECINSGRVPTTSRCTTANLSFVCYSRLQNGEKITYVYRNTAAESYFRKSCPNEDAVPGNKVPRGGASFRNNDVKLVLICAPAGSDTTAD
jgi:hypothetical protein